MSQNLLVAIEQEDHNDEVRPMILTRFIKGLTHSAAVTTGDIIQFDGLDCTIGRTCHKFELGDIAPVSECYGSFHRPLSDTEIDRLKQFGFKDLTSESNKKIQQVHIHHHG